MLRSFAAPGLLLAVLAAGTFPAQAAPIFIDLSKAANMGPAQSLDAAVPGGEDLKEKEGFANIPQGPQTLRGIPFQMLQAESNQGRSFITLKGRRLAGFPEAVAINAGGIKAENLYFLHSCRWGGTASNITVAEYDIVYADGRVQVIPLKVGEELTNFTGSDDTPASYLAWWRKYKNIDMGLNLFAWKNPLPDVPIQTILFKSLNKVPVPMLFAITASDAELPIASTSPKPEKTFQTDTNGWIPFKASTGSPVGTAIDMSSLLDAPAGKHGKVKADGGKLVFEDGTQARFWGIRFKNKNDFLPGVGLSVASKILPIYGCNLVSFDPPSSDEVEPSLKDLVESFKAQGVYVELDCDDKWVISSGVCNDPAVVPQKIWISGHPVQNDPTDNPDGPFNFDDKPMVLDPETSFPTQLNHQRKLGLPFVAEWFERWPNEYSAEMPLLMASYGAFEDWAGCLNEETITGGGISFIHPGSTDDENKDEATDQPVLDRGQQLDFQRPVAALAYIRGDLKPGRVNVLGEGDSPLATLAHRSGLEPEGGKDRTDPAGLLKAKVSEKNKTVVSDTEQIRWQGNVGLFQVSSPRFQAAVGFLGHRKIVSPVWQVESPNFFASLSLISLTKTNLWASDHMLLTGVTRMENTGQVYNAAKTKLIAQGTAPILVEPLQAKITIFRYKADPKLGVRALDANGQILNTNVRAKWVKNNLIFSWIPEAFYLEVFKKQ